METLELFERDIIEAQIEEFLEGPVPEDYTVKDKSRAKRRKEDAKKAIRKRKLARELYTYNSESTWEWYNNLHQYSKNKIHCSCPLCRAKTNDNGRKNWKHSDLLKIESLEEKEKEPA